MRLNHLALAVFLTTSSDTAAQSNLRDGCAVVWFDVQATVPLVFEGATAEAASVLRQAGLTCTFRRGEYADRGEIPLIVLGDRQSPGNRNWKTMGAADPTPVDQVPAIRVFMNPLLGLLRQHPADRRPQTVARALGRVIAHEIIHLAAPRLPHASHGLMKASLTVGDLLGETIVVDAATLSALNLLPDPGSSTPPSELATVAGAGPLH